MRAGDTWLLSAKGAPVKVSQLNAQVAATVDNWLLL